MRNQEREIIWVVVNTNSEKEADKIGHAVLKERLCACYGIIPRIKSVYYWPPKSNKLEVSRGPLLTLETLEKNYKKIVQLVKKLHSDKVPFIGQWEMENVEPNFYKWLKGELNN
jgi:periplasmic divalent cation tolerance protein